MTAATPPIVPFDLSIADDDLIDLQQRLTRTRWPEAATTPGNDQGPGLDAMQELVAYWRDVYDWRATERLLNASGQFTTLLNGLEIHFLHIRSPRPDAVPLLLCHGWPGSVLEFRDVWGPLSDPAAHGAPDTQAYHLVIPSMPGFGFSEKPTSPGWGPGSIAGAWAQLMGRLGYTQWVAQGGDWGAAVVEALSWMQPAGLRAVHFNLPLVFPTRDETAQADDAERAMIADAARYQDELSAYAKEQTTRPQTIGYCLNDSPVGLAAWIYQLFVDVSDTDGRPERLLGWDAILDDIMLYWLPGTGASSARLYREASSEMASMTPPVTPNPTPAGFSIFPREAQRASRRWIERRYATVLHYRQLDCGGHFAALEQPSLFVGEIRDTFATVPDQTRPDPSPRHRRQRARLSRRHRGRSLMAPGHGCAPGWVNLVEVYYLMERDHGRERAAETLTGLRGVLSADLPGTARDDRSRAVEGTRLNRSGRLLRGHDRRRPRVDAADR